MKPTKKAALPSNGPSVKQRNKFSAKSPAVQPSDDVNKLIDLAIDAETAPSKIRILKYLKTHPDAFTHDIAKACALSWPPNRLGELNRGTLRRFGLYAWCHEPPSWLRNRYGDTSYVRQWRIVKLGDPRIANSNEEEAA